MKMQNQLHPDQVDEVLGLLALVGVDFGYIPLHTAEFLLIHGLIEVHEEYLITASGKKPIEVFTLTQDAIDFVAQVKNDLPASLNDAFLISQFGSLPNKGKKKWVVSRYYFKKWRAAERRMLPKSVIRRWRPTITL